MSRKRYIGCGIRAYSLGAVTRLFASGATAKAPPSCRRERTTSGTPMSSRIPPANRVSRAVPYSTSASAPAARIAASSNTTMARMISFRIGRSRGCRELRRPSVRRLRAPLKRRAEMAFSAARDRGETENDKQHACADVDEAALPVQNSGDETAPHRPGTRVPPFSAVVSLLLLVHPCPVSRTTSAFRPFAPACPSGFTKVPAR